MPSLYLFWIFLSSDLPYTCRIHICRYTLLSLFNRAEYRWCVFVNMISFVCVYLNKVYCLFNLWKPLEHTQNLQDIHCRFVLCPSARHVSRVIIHLHVYIIYKWKTWNSKIQKLINVQFIIIGGFIIY